jgi:hypothetical protein
MITAVLLLAGLLAVCLVAAKRSVDITDQTRRFYQDERVFYVAEAGVESAAAWLQALLPTNPNPAQTALDAVTPPTISGFNFVELSITKQPLIPNGRITEGPFAGVIGDIQPFLIRSDAELSNSSVEKVVRLTVNQQAIAMEQFGIFYDGDLEIFPSYPFYYYGRIHTNGNLFLGSSNVLNIDGPVTAGGHIYNSPKDSAMDLNGKARVTDPSGQWHDLSYDSRDPNWVTKSMDDWQGRVLDSAHYGERMILPRPLLTPMEAIEIIKRGQPTDNAELMEERFYYKADLRIIDGVGSNGLGQPVTIPAGVITDSNFYDYREQRTFLMHQINVGAMMAAGITPANGILYISYAGANEAVRIADGAQLPVGGFTMATDNPCYVRGNYNTINKQPASVLCDAFNALSTNWVDANSTKNLNQRIAFATTMNTCIVAGNTPTDYNDYNGGAENLIRLHEKWVGHELTQRGSLVCIWESERATGDFANASYVEAHRDWGFDPDLLDPNYWPIDRLRMKRVVRGAWQSF